MNFNGFLTFSDGAKFAIIARNMVQGTGFVTDFSFWGSPLFATGGIPALIPYLMSIFMKLFGTADFAVIAFSLTFYIFLIIAVFLLGRKLFGNLVGVLSALAVASNLNFIDYATSGASETLFAFEIILAFYLLSFKKIWINLFGLLILGLMYFTRPQAFIFMAGISFFWLIYKLGLRKGAMVFFGFGVIGFLIDKFIIYPLSFKYPLTPIFMRGLQSIFTYSSFNAVSDGLRGGVSSNLTLNLVLKKVFYNLYNFYKAIPEILNPYLFVLFVFSIFNRWKDGLRRSFFLGTVFSVFLIFFVTALTIPFYRYLHPAVPLIYILAGATLVNIISKIYTTTRSQTVVSLILISIFCLGQLAGYLFLDSRFVAKRVNIGKPPVYAVLSYKLKEVTNKDETVLTNLDTWGSWYGERKTVWFPLTPEMFLISPHYQKFDAIYLTSYKMDDENYYMGEKWREIYSNPKNQKILPDYELVGEYDFNSADNYENTTAHSILLKKKTVK